MEFGERFAEQVITHLNFEGKQGFIERTNQGNILETYGDIGIRVKNETYMVIVNQS